MLGGGPLAIQLVFAALVRGIAVQWGTRDPAALREGVPRLRDVFDEFVRRGALSEDDALDRLADLRIGDSAAMTGGVEMIVLRVTQFSVAIATDYCDVFSVVFARQMMQL